MSPGAPQQGGAQLAWRGVETWNRLEITPHGKTEGLVCWWLWQKGIRWDGHS